MEVSFEKWRRASFNSQYTVKKLVAKLYKEGIKQPFDDMIGA